MKKSREIIVRFISFLALFIFFLTVLVYGFVFVSCFHASKVVPDYAPYPMVRIEFLGRGIDTVSARFSLFDTSGHEFSVIERSWSGESLGLEFATASFGEKTFSFPVRVYPKGNFANEKRRGTNLSHYYFDHGKNMFLGTPCTDWQRKAFHTLAVFALWQSSHFESRFSHTIKIDLSSCQKDHTYDVISDSRGMLTLTEM